MRIEPPKNPNYCAVVTTVRRNYPLENCDNLLGSSFFGNQALVGKDTAVGTLGIVFSPETQLSQKFLSENNLYRDPLLNSDTTKKGYFETNGRVRAIKFRGHVSSCFFVPLDMLNFTGFDTSFLKEGDEFDTLNDVEICKKYEVKVREPRANRAVKGKKDSRVDAIHFPEHFQTENFFRNIYNVSPKEEVIVTQKLHGTSIRVGNTLVKRKLSLLEKFAKLLGVKVKETEYDYIYGSRKVIKDSNNPDHQHFYEEDIWTTEGTKLKGVLPEGYIVYAELIGWTAAGSEIQKNYTYEIPKGQCEMYIYRITNVNEKGYVTDLSWQQIKQFCFLNNLKCVPEIVICKLKDLDVNKLLEVRLFDYYTQCLMLGGNPDIVDEGVCVRVEGLKPYIMKAKSQKFLLHESSLLDKGEEDLESSQSNENSQ